MTQASIENIKNSKILPKDELDDFWGNIFGFFPVTMLLVGSTLSLFAKRAPESSSIEFKLVFILMSLILFLYTVWTKMTERKLKTVFTNLNRQQNLAVIEKLANENSWSIKTNKSYYKEYIIPFAFGQARHKLTVVILDNEILYNLRNLGSGRGRMPYSLGIDTIKELKFRKEIKNCI